MSAVLIFSRLVRNRKNKTASRIAGNDRPVVAVRPQWLYRLGRYVATAEGYKSFAAAGQANVLSNLASAGAAP